MANEASKYFMGDVYAADVGVGFLVKDNRGESTDPEIDEATARAIVAACDGNPNVALSPVNLFEISEEEFALYRDTEIQVPESPGRAGALPGKEIAARA